jgi:hypothetical protein
MTETELRDRPVTDEADIEVTEAMIEAGDDELGAFWLGITGGSPKILREAVKAIFLRMTLVQRADKGAS